VTASAAPGPLLFDLGARGDIVLTGKDRATFLQGLVTNDVVKLAEGGGCAAAFLSAKGKLQAICVVLADANGLVLDTPPELAAMVEALLRKYLVFADVTIEDHSAEASVLHLAGEASGDAAEDLLRKVMSLGGGATFPAALHAHTRVGEVMAVRENRTGVPGYDLRLPSSDSKELLAALQTAGAQLQPPERLEALRVAAGIPRWGAELTEAVLPDEAGLRERGFISETKGCYVGQEIVARIKTYGHVNRLLVRLEVSGGVPSPGDGVFFQGEKAGALTSVAPAAGNGAVALAYVKRDRASEGTALTISPLEENPSSLPSSRSLPARVAPAPLV
jgi:folate-binding protein YgfZ